MELDTKQKVLIAIYTEYQKDIPEMKKNISSKKLEIDEKTFLIAIDKLENEGLINGIRLIKAEFRPCPVKAFFG